MVITTREKKNIAILLIAAAALCQLYFSKEKVQVFRDSALIELQSVRKVSVVAHDIVVQDNNTIVAQDIVVQDTATSDKQDIAAQDTTTIFAKEIVVQDNVTTDAQDIVAHDNITADDEVLDYFSESTFYHCGYNPTGKFRAIFPELSERLKNSKSLTYENMQNASEHDFLLHGLGGNCLGWRMLKADRKELRQMKFLEEHFNGRVLYFNGESEFAGAWKRGDPPKRAYHFGHIADGCQSLRMRFLQQLFMSKTEKFAPTFLQGSAENRRPHSEKEKFLLYVNSNCVDFREKAFDDIALANNNSVVEWGGKCSGNLKNLTNKKQSSMLKFNGLNNNLRMREYRFCFVLENKKDEGYITEKIMFAFAGGCIPIYYGGEDIFDIFNPKAFIYYNISDPEAALNKIQYLEGNQSAYNDVMAEPILLDGNNTIDKYFYADHETTPTAMRDLRKKTFRLLKDGGC